jgi:glucose-1-phosphate adenylyltransferase
MGIYIFNRDVLSQRLAENAQTDLPHDFGYAILPGMIGRDKVNSYEFTGYWRDIGTPQAYYVASMELLSARPPFSLNGRRPVLTRRLDLTLSHISDQAKVVNSLISPGCVIEGYVENSILSPGVWVDERAEVWNSVLMQNSFVGYHIVVDTCIMDEHVNIGELCYIGFGASLLPGYGEITLVERGVSVSVQTVINSNSRVLPDAEISSLKSSPIALDPTLMEHSKARKRWVNQEVQTNERESMHIA